MLLFFKYENKVPAFSKQQHYQPINGVDQAIKAQSVTIIF